MVIKWSIWLKKIKYCNSFGNEIVLMCLRPFLQLKQSYLEQIDACLGVDFVMRWTGKLLKNLKTPFFSRYSKFLPMANWYRSRTSPKFFLKKNSNKCGRKSCPKFWPKWAVASRLIEQWPKFWYQFSKITWWTNAENFKKIAWFSFE